ncbi:MAG: hypothetical protein WC375_08065 [Methanomassiliicoccales archaeon]|jgi:hypothetical protein
MQVFSNYAKIISPSDKIAISRDENLSVNPIRGQRLGAKPQGLWYGCGIEWIQWNINSSFGKADNIFKIEIDQKSILQLETQSDLDRFILNYSLPVRSSNFFKSKFYDGNISTYHIDWRHVASKYDGIEISPLCTHLMRTCQLRPLRWNVPSNITIGCVWEQSIIVQSILLHPLQEFFPEMA